MACSKILISHVGALPHGQEKPVVPQSMDDWIANMVIDIPYMSNDSLQMLRSSTYPHIRSAVLKELTMRAEMIQWKRPPYECIDEEYEIEEATEWMMFEHKDEDFVPYGEE